MSLFGSSDDTEPEADVVDIPDAEDEFFDPGELEDYIVTRWDGRLDISHTENKKMWIDGPAVKLGEWR
jgi:hypothetical protein